MKIETKFNKGDVVYYLLDHKICKGIVELPIETITTTDFKGKLSTTIYCNINNGTLPYKKHDMNYLFATKQELLDSL